MAAVVFRKKNRTAEGTLRSKKLLSASSIEDLRSEDEINENDLIMVKTQHLLREKAKKVSFDPNGSVIRGNTFKKLLNQ